MSYSRTLLEVATGSGGCPAVSRQCLRSTSRGSGGNGGEAAPRGRNVDGVGRVHKVTGWCLWVIGGGGWRATSTAAVVEGRGGVQLWWFSWHQQPYWPHTAAAGGCHDLSGDGASSPLCLASHRLLL